MPADLLTQLEALGHLLDRTVEPVTIDELTRTTTSSNAPAANGAVLLEVHAPDNVDSGRRWLPRLVGVAAAALLIGGGIVALIARESHPDSGNTATTLGPQTTTIDHAVPLTLFPAGSVLRFSSALDGTGTIEVYDTADHTQVCAVIRADGGTWGGCFDTTIFDTGQAWSYVGQGADATQRLVGITPTNIGFHATVAGKTLTPDTNGLWYTTVQPGTPNFTITTNQGTSQYPLDQNSSTSTIAVQGSTP